MSHTRGPWAVEWSEEEGNDGVTIESPDGPVAFRVLEVDARLIAAAPEMLDALRLAADAIDLAQAQVDSENDRYNLCKRLVAVKRVIAKAEGRE